MGGAFVSAEGKTQEEAKAKMEPEQARAKKLGFIERAQRMLYDEQKKVWIFAIWFHS